MQRQTYQKITWQQSLARLLLIQNTNQQRPRKQYPAMKSSSFKTSRRQALTLGDLVLAVSSVSRNSNETAAAVTDLLESGRVRLTNNGRILRARIA